MKRPNAKQWAMAMSASTGVLAIACVVFATAAFGMFFYNYFETDELRVQYANDANHYTYLVSQYTRHFETHGTWPAPGTYTEDGFEYQSTLTLPTGEREDVYHTDYDGHMSIHFELRQNGEIRVWPFLF